MRRFVFLALLMTACSLIYGLHDNVPPDDDASIPIDASADIVLDTFEAAPPAWNGCPSEAGTHTLCEFFDESPPWPSDAAITTRAGPIKLATDDAGCPTSPSCVIADNTNAGYVQITKATPAGVNELTYDIDARFDQNALNASTTPRIMWIDFATTKGLGTITFGLSFAPAGGTGPHEAFLFWTGHGGANNSGLTPPLQYTLGHWYHFRLQVELDGSSPSVSFTCASPSSSVLLPFANFGTPVFKPEDVSSVTVYAGMYTGDSQTGGAFDSIVVDIMPAP